MDNYKIKIPEFLESSFYFTEKSLISIRSLRVGIIDKKTKKTKYVPIFETPHFHFAKIHITDVYDEKKNKNYNEYIKLNHPNKSETEFRNLIESIIRNNYDHHKYPILVFKSRRRLSFFPKWKVADGFHRLAVISALGHDKVYVGKLKFKKSFLQKVWEILRYK